MDKTYEAPSLTVQGSMSDLTLKFNKNGLAPDMYSNVVPIVGSRITGAHK